MASSVGHPLAPLDSTDDIDVLRLPTPVSIRDDTSTLRLLGVLRDATGLGCTVDWRLGSIEEDSPVDLPALVHLHPPSSDGEVARSWQRAYRYGRLFWRKGPGFVLIKDSRARRSAKRYTLTEPSAVEQFVAMYASQSPCDADALSRTLLSALLRTGLAVRSGDEVLPLPYRLARWPIPAYSL